MKNVAILAASFALANFAVAVPLNNKRDIIYKTQTEEVWETLWTTKTEWVEPTGAPVANGRNKDVPHSKFNGGFFEKPVLSTSLPNSLPAVPTTLSTSSIGSSVSVSVPAVAPTTSTSVSVSTPEVIIPTTSAPEPTTSVPAPTTSVPAPAAIIPTKPSSPPMLVKASEVPSVAAPAATNVPVASSGTFTGDITHYDVSVGLSSCGLTGSNDQPLVALAAPDMQNGANPNKNPKCGKRISIVYNGQSHTGIVHDTCPECTGGSIDLTESLFKLVAPNGDGRVHGVSWSFID